MNPWDGLADTILETIKARARSTWDGNAEAREFVTERTKRLAKLTWEYKTAGGDQERELKKKSMDLVADTIETELLAIALDAEANAKVAFRETVSIIFKTLAKALPAVLALV